MNHQFSAMNYPSNFTARSVSQNPPQNTENSRPNESEKRPPFMMSYVPMIPFRIQAPQPNQMQANMSPMIRMPDQPAQFPQSPQNLGDQMNIQANILYYQNGFKQLFEANAFLHMVLEQRSLALEQRNLENIRLKTMFEEVYAEKIKLGQYYQNLIAQQQSNSFFPQNTSNQVPNLAQQTFPNSSATGVKNSKIEQKSKKSDKQHKSLKSQQKDASPNKKKLSPEENSKKKQNSAKEKDLKRITAQKDEETQEKKIMSFEEESQEEEIKKPQEEFKYYHKTFETKQALMEYKNKLRGRESSANVKEIIKKPEQRRARNKNYEYIQLDNAPKALKKLKEEYIMKKQQYLKAKENSKTNGLEEENNLLKRNKSKSKAKKNESNQSRQNESVDKDENMKKRLDSKKKKQPITPTKDFLSDAPQQSESSEQKEVMPQYSILKPLLEVNRNEPIEPDVYFSSQPDLIKSKRQPAKKEEISLESLGKLIDVQEKQNQQNDQEAQQQKDLSQKNKNIDEDVRASTKKLIHEYKFGIKKIFNEVQENLNSGQGAIHSQIGVQFDVLKDMIQEQKTKNLEKSQQVENNLIDGQQNVEKIVLECPQNPSSNQIDSLKKSDDGLNQKDKNQSEASQKIEFVQIKDVFLEKKAQDQSISQSQKVAQLQNQASEVKLSPKNVYKSIIVHYDHEEKEKFEMKEAKIKKKKQKVKIPCLKDDAFMIIRNWRGYQRLTGYNIVFQGVFQTEEQLKKDFATLKYDQEFTYNMPKKQKKQRKARGKYKKRQNKKLAEQASEQEMTEKQMKQEEDNSEEEQDEMIENSESQGKHKYKDESAGSI